MSIKRVSFILMIAILAVFLFSTPTQAANAATCTQYHTVQWGETLYRISRWYGTTVAELQRVNNLGGSTWIYAGQALCVSAYDNGVPVYNRTYTVQWGDSLSGIARYFGVDVYWLAQANNIANINWIYAGQVLTIPS